MQGERYRVEFAPGVLEDLDEFSQRSTRAKLQVGSILQKAETFDLFGTENCNATSDIRCVGQHEVLPISSGNLHAFVELRHWRTEGEILFVDEVVCFGDLRRVWEKVHAHFGYESDTGPSTRQEFARDWAYYL